MPNRRTATAEPKTERLNGTAPTELQSLEPMERMPECGAPAPWGVNCTLEDFHPGSHSWGGEKQQLEHGKACAFTLSEGGDPCECGAVDHGQAHEENETVQDTSAYEVPLEGSFGNRKLLDAPGLREIGERLIREEDAFEHLRGVQVGWFWKRRGGKKGGEIPNYGGLKRPDEFVRHYAGSEPEYLIWIAADHAREVHFTAEQIEAHLHEQLSRTGIDPDNHDAYRVFPPDFVGSVATLRKYGVGYKAELREAAYHIQQLPLIELPAPPDVDDEDDEDPDLGPEPNPTDAPLFEDDVKETETEEGN